MNPLSQLEDIQLPDTVSMWPLAPGYWIIIAVVLIISILLAWYIKNRLKTREKRRFERNVIAYINALDESDEHCLLNVQKALKTVAERKLKEISSTPSAAISTKARIGSQWKEILRKSELIEREPHAIDVLFNVHQGLYDPSISPASVVDVKKYAVSWVKSDWRNDNKGSDL